MRRGEFAVHSRQTNGFAERDSACKVARLLIELEKQPGCKLAQRKYEEIEAVIM